MKILIVAPPVAPLGDGRTGGITRHISNTVHAFALKRHECAVVAPEGSILDNCSVFGVSGTPQPTLARPEDQGVYPIPAEPLVGRLWQAALHESRKYDLVLNFSHDWLPYFLTEFFDPPLCHIVNMSDVNDATSKEIARVQRLHPYRVAFMTRAQAERLGDFSDPLVVSFGIDMAVYTFNSTPQHDLAWAGRISREKGLEDALSIAQSLGTRLVVAGAVDDESYWAGLCQRFEATIDYRGFLDTDGLQRVLGSARALLQTQRWHEAFGIVTVEAMASGTPVIAYDKGANTELIVNGETGFLVPENDADAAESCFHKIGAIKRDDCRRRAEEYYSLSAYAETIDRWVRSAGM